MSDSEKVSIIQQMYVNEKKSLKQIADALNTYPNKIRRDAVKYKISLRDKSEAQANALQTGNHKHPTKGTLRDESTKQKIGISVLQSWEELSDNELEDRKLKAKNNWDNLSEDNKKYMQQKANEAVRLSSKSGSKLEKFILQKLIGDGYKVNFHQEQLLSNTKLQIDIFIPSINVAIEIDGPSHFLPVWGDDVLKRNQKYDQKKEGLIVGKGITLIRIKQTKDFSKSRASLLYNQLVDTIKNISSNQKLYTIED